jgi:hypothetical protein
MAYTATSLYTRFMKKVTRTDDCWLWTGAISSNGYGNAWNGKRQIGAHRMIYELLIGQIPEGLQLDHLCKTRNCVNPSHLEAVTAQENNARSSSPSAKNKIKTHCPQGHKYSSDNTHISKLGRRHCKTCLNNHAKAYYWRKRGIDVVHSY